MKLNLDHPVRNSQDLALAEIESMNRNWIRAVEGYRASERERTRKLRRIQRIGFAFAMIVVVAIFLLL
ncbi:MAG: hypothetical protein WAM58_08110 [Candidatus Acidiferrum sp.]